MPDLDPLIVQLAAIRVDRGLSQRSVASAIGENRQSLVSEMERGLHEPLLSTFRRYAAALGFTLQLVPLPDEVPGPEVSDAPR